MNTFKEHLLLERIGKSDVIDLFLIMSMPAPASKANKFIIDEVINNARRRILDEFEDIILDELGHIGEVRENDPDITTEMFTGIIRNLFGKRYTKPFAVTHKLDQVMAAANNRKEGLTIRAINKEMNNSKMTFNRIADTFESKKIWGEGYGGPSWAQLTRLVSNLHKQKEASNFLREFERLVDLVHNTGSFLEKFAGHREGWLPFILNLKQSTQNIRDLFPYVSKDVRKVLNDPNWRIQTHQVTQGREVSEEIPEKVLSDALINRKIDVRTAFGYLFLHYGKEKVKQDAIKLINKMDDVDFQDVFDRLQFMYDAQDEVIRYLSRYVKNKWLEGK